MAAIKCACPRSGRFLTPRGFQVRPGRIAASSTKRPRPDSHLPLLSLLGGFWRPIRAGTSKLDRSCDGLSLFGHADFAEYLQKLHPQRVIGIRNLSLTMLGIPAGNRMPVHRSARRMIRDLPFCGSYGPRGHGCEIPLIIRYHVFLVAGSGDTLTDTGQIVVMNEQPKS
jgi:hypothetical protein